MRGVTPTDVGTDVRLKGCGKGREAAGRRTGWTALGSAPAASSMVTMGSEPCAAQAWSNERSRRWSATWSRLRLASRRNVRVVCRCVRVMGATRACFSTDTS